ncbi:MAG: hypothetical protein AAF432_12115 [Planctomycetota bacterium]
MKRYAIKVVLIVFALAVIGGGFAVAWTMRASTSSFYTDGGAIRENLDQAPVRDVLWEPPVPVRWSNSSAYEYEPHVSRDGQVLLLVRGRAGGNADIYVAKRTTDGWTDPEPLEAINSEADDLGPAFSPDGSTLFFYSNRAGGHGGFDLWMAPRQDDQFGVPVNLGPLVNSPLDDYGPAPMAAGTVVVFASNRVDPSTDDTVDERGDNVIVEPGDYDLFTTTRDANGNYGPAVPLDIVNSEFEEGAPAVAPRGDFLYFASDRPGGEGGFDLYRSRIMDGVVDEPKNLDQPVNTEANELDPAIMAEGFGLIFSSDRDREEGTGLLFSASREVFRYDETARGEVDWAALWDFVRPYVIALILLLLALLLIPLLAKILFGDREKLGPASLLLKCLFVSVLVHFVLMLLLTVWAVATGMPDYFRPGRGTRVVLTSPSVSMDAASQVTGPLSESASIQPTVESVDRLMESIAVATSSARADVTPMESDVPLPVTPMNVEVVDAQPVDESTVTPDVQTASQLESTTDVELPQMPNAERESQSESQASVQPTIVADATAATYDAKTSEQATDAAAVSMAVDAARAQVAAASAESTVETAPTDAATDSPTPLEQADAPAQLTSTTIAVDLPTDANVNADRASESSEAQIAAQVEAMPRFDTADVASQGTMTAERTDVQPATTALASQGSLESTATAVDAASPSMPTPIEATPDAASTRDNVQLAIEMPSDGQPEQIDEADAASTSAASSAVASSSERLMQDEMTTPTGASAVATMAPSASTAASESTTFVGTTATEATAASSNELDVDAPMSLVIDMPNVDVRAPSTGESNPDVESESVTALAMDATMPSASRSTAQASISTLASDEAQVATTPTAAQVSIPAASMASPTVEDQMPSVTSTLAPIDADASMIMAPAPMVSVSMPTDGGGTADDVDPVMVADTGATSASSSSQRADMIAPSSSPVDSTVAFNPDAANVADAMEGFITDTAATSSAALADLPDGLNTDLIAVELPSPLAVDVALDMGDTGSVEGEREMGALAMEESVLDPAGAASAASTDAMFALQDPTIATAAPGIRAIEVESFAPSNALSAPATTTSDTEAPAPPVRVARIDPLTAITPSTAFAEEAPPVVAADTAPYAQRAPERREAVLEEMGGSRETEEAVERALAWLASRQQPDGRWDGKNFGPDGGPGRGAARAKVDTAITGLALLCFLAADHTHIDEGPYQDNVDRAIDWLVDQQDNDGSLIGRESMYSHGIASIALAEAYGMSKDPALEASVQDAIDFIFDARNRTTGGWRYAPGQVGDTSVMGWQIMALTSARRAGIDVPEEAFDVGRAWLELVADDRNPGRFAYRPGRASSPAMTAESLFVHGLLGSDPKQAQMAGSAEYLLRNLPEANGNQSTYYWYYATLAMFQYGGDAWEAWNESLKDALLSTQNTRGIDAGSWDPDDKWANVGGRVYQTAICTLTLEVYYRYLPLYLSDPAEEDNTGLFFDTGAE